MKKNISELKLGIILNYINQILGNLIPIFYTPVMLNLLGQEEYGLYKLSSSVTSYLSLLSLGIGSAVTRYLIKANTEEGKESEERVLGLFVIIFKIIALSTLIVGGILSLNLHLFYSESLSDNELARMRIIVILLVINTAISLSATPYTAVVSSHEKFVFLQIVNIMSTCIMPIINLIVLYFGFASIGMTVSSLIISVVIRIMYLVYVKKSMKITASYKNLPTHLLKEILNFSFWVFVANVVTQLYNATDTILIGAVPSLATVGVAVYNIGITFVNIVGSLSTAVSSLLTPKINKLVFSGASNSELTDYSIYIGRIQAFVVSLFASGFIAFGKQFISIYVGDGYEKAYFVAILIILPNMIPSIQSICLNVIVAQNKHKFRSIVYLAIAILNVIGTWFSLDRYGIVGAAFVSGLALFIGAGVILNIYYWKKIKLDIPRFWKSIYKIFLIPTIMCIITIFISKFMDFENILNFIVGVLVYTTLFIMLNWLFVMNKTEKNIILLIIHKIKRKH